MSSRNKSKHWKPITPSKFQQLLDELSGISASESETSDSDSDHVGQESKISESDHVGQENKLSEPNISNLCKISLNLSIDNINLTPSKENSNRLLTSTPIKPNPIKITFIDEKHDANININNYQNLDNLSLSNDKEKHKYMVNDEKQSLDRPKDENQIKDDTIEANVNLFIGKPGIITEKNLETPLDYFHLFVNKNLLKYFTYETNLYARQTKKENPSFYKHWRPVDIKDMANYLGLNILFGIFKLPRIHMYWATGELYSSSGIRSLMTFNRFQEINAFFHAFNNKAIPTECTDRIIKVRSLTEYFIYKFKDTYTPEKNLSLDEGIMPFRGKLNFKTYNPNKPDKYGIKFYILSEAKSGYVYNFKIYCGEGNTTSEIVCNLSKDLRYKGYHLYMDNFYNSTKLACELLNKKIYMCGTFRINRGAPKDFQENAKKLKKDEVLFQRVNNISFIAWQDKKTIPIISTIHNNATTVPVEVRERKTINGQKKYSKGVVNKPLAIMDYNKYMGGVDHFDQMVKYYQFITKSQKWTRKVIFYLLQMAMHNAFVLYKKFSQVEKKLDYMGFQTTIYKSLLEFDENKWPECPLDSHLNHSPDLDVDLSNSEDVANYSCTAHCEPISTSESTNEVTNVSEDMNRPNKRKNFSDFDIIRLDNSLKHVLSKHPENKRRNCRVCLKNKLKEKPKLTWYRCEICTVHLCPNKCFSSYHEKKQY